MQIFSSRDAFENDFCPVRDELLGEMYRANENGLPKLVESVSSEVRAMLALFCYRRSHLHSLALSIAASCSERELIQLGGRVGSTLYALSREPAARSAPSSSYGNRQSMPSARHRTFDIAGHAGPAHLGPHGINGARGSHSDLARQCRTAVAVAAHARQPFVDEFFRNQIGRGVVLGGEARPVLRIGTAGPTGLAGVLRIDV